MATATRTAILVLGMHRSGTSACAGVLARAGAAAPHNVLPPNFANERGYFESLPFMHLHDALLASAGSRWDDWRAFPPGWFASPVAAEFQAKALALLESEFGDAPLVALKDPRMCRFVPFWLDALAQAKCAPRIVIPFRAPREVARSLAVRDRFALETGLLLWLRHVLDAERATRGLPRAFVAMDDLIADWRGALARIGRQTRLAWPALDAAAGRDIDAFLAPSLKHHAAAPARRPADWAGRAHAALRQLARNPNAAPAKTGLDRIAADFDQACALFGPLAAPAADPLPALDAGARKLRHRREGLRAGLAAAPD